MMVIYPFYNSDQVNMFFVTDNSIYLDIVTLKVQNQKKFDDSYHYYDEVDSVEED